MDGWMDGWHEEGECKNRTYGVGVQSELVVGDLIHALESIDLTSVGPVRCLRPPSGPHGALCTTPEASEIAESRGREDKARQTHSIRHVQHIRDEDAPDAVRVFRRDADGVALVVERDGRGVVDLHDGVARAVHEREIVRLRRARV